MRRITLWLLSTVAAVVLLFSYRTSTVGGPATATAVSAEGGTVPDGSGAQSSSAANGGTANGGTANGGTANGGTATFQGSVAQTRWGPVQVVVTVTNGKITSVAVPTYPNGNSRDREINARALPILNRETVAAQSADIDVVSGATVTSDGYKQSLRAALDAAHLS